MSVCLYMSIWKGGEGGGGDAAGQRCVYLTAVCLYMSVNAC